MREASLSVNRSMSFTFEEACLEKERMKDVEVVEEAGMTVYSGEHPDYGCIHIIIPAVGDGIALLPFVIRKF